MENPMVNYQKINKETLSNHYNVRDEFKNNSVQENIAICNKDRLKFSVGCINITGELNIGMMLRSACLFGAENFYIFGRNKFDKRSTVGAENYINIVQYVFDDPIHADMQIAQKLLDVKKMMEHTIVLCDTGGHEIGKYTTWNYFRDQNPLFIFGSESHGIPSAVSEQFKNKVSIPQRGVMRSFNVSAAMNIICWDYVKEMHL
jgi:tRNA G18 (ribose-2'-O)-methylase SpoU